MVTEYLIVLFSWFFVLCVVGLIFRNYSWIFIKYCTENWEICFLTFCWPCISVYLSQYLTNLMHKICFTIRFISCLYMFRAHVLIIRRSKLQYTASGIITPIGGHLVHVTATYRCDDTRGCVIQFWPPDDEHMCSKHGEAWNKNLFKTNFVHQVG